MDRLAAAIESVPGASLLDRTSDASHNRSAFTPAGEDDAVVEALDRLVGAAIDRGIVARTFEGSTKLGPWAVQWIEGRGAGANQRLELHMVPSVEACQPGVREFLKMDLEPDCDQGQSAVEPEINALHLCTLNAPRSDRLIAYHPSC